MAADGITEPVPGIWCVKRRGVASYIVRLSPGAVLIDAGAEKSGSAVMMGLQAARVGLSSVRAILLTSHTPDATGGLEALRARSGAPVYGPRDGDREPGITPLHALEHGERVQEHFEAVASSREADRLGYFFRPARALFAGRGLGADPGPLGASLTFLGDGTCRRARSTEPPARDRAR